MSKSNTRRVRNATFGRVDGYDDDAIALTFHGTTKRGAPVKITVELQWWSFPYMVSSIREKWTEARKQRLNAIQRIDDSFPPPPIPF